MVTPFRDGQIDEAAFVSLIERQMEAGIDGVVPMGTTGESPTANFEEHLKVIELAVKAAAGRVKVIAGTGANSTAEAIELTEAAYKMGADGTLQVCPYYNKPSQEGLYAHFRTIAEATPLPMMLYSIPGRSVIEISVDTVVRLAADCPTICCIKEAGGNVDRVNQLVQALPEEFTILSGDDPLTLPFISCGAKGLVSVASNVVPAEMNSLVKACLSGDFAQALALQKKYYPLLRGLMTLDTNPVPVKEALALQGYMSNEIRLPLVNLTAEKRQQLSELLAQFELL